MEGRIQSKSSASVALASARGLSWEVRRGDCLRGLRKLAADSVDSVVCDPPYEIGIQGQAWDRTGIAFSEELWTEVLRVLKPGGFLLAFGAPRKSHRLVSAIENAGFLIRDQLAWCHAQSKPPSYDLQKAAAKRGDDLSEYEGYGTALRPSHEPIALAQKQLDGNLAENVDRWGVGLLNIGACRLRPEGVEPEAPARWPSNFFMDAACAAEMDRQSGERKTSRSEASSLGRQSTGFGSMQTNRGPRGFNDTGGASRFFGSSGDVESEPEMLPNFFYVAKPTTAERNAGLTKANPHNTVKPLRLMRLLVRLVTPKPGQLVMDVFAGSGTTGCAAALEGFSFLGFELDAKFARTAEDRIAHWANQAAA